MTMGPEEFRATMRALADRAARALARVLNDPTHPDHDAVAKRVKRYPRGLVAAARKLGNTNLAPDFGKSARLPEGKQRQKQRALRDTEETPGRNRHGAAKG